MKRKLEYWERVTRIRTDYWRLEQSGVTRRVERDDAGSLVAVLVLIVVVALLIAVTVAAVVPSFSTATTSRSGEQAVAQADAGLSDAVFHIDQLGDNPTGFCAGNPPASLVPAGVSCFLTGTAPIASAPGVRWYVGKVIAPPSPNGLPVGVVDDEQVTVKAVVAGQSRTVTADIYRVADSFGIFGVSAITDDGALKNAQVYEVSGFPPSEVKNGAVYIGTGPGGQLTCHGNSSSDVDNDNDPTSDPDNDGDAPVLYEIGQNGAQIVNCSNPQQQTTNFEPSDPTICASGQTSSAFQPCIDTSSFANVGGVPYCPLYGSGIPNTLSLTTSVAPPSQNAVFDCATSGTAVTLGSSPTSSSPFCSSPSSSPLPFGLTTIPSGSYYFDTNSLTVDCLDPSLFSGAVSIFDLADACGANPDDGTSVNCPVYIPPGTAPSPNTNATLSLLGRYVNASNAASGSFDFTPGNPADFSLYWNGNDPIAINSPISPTKPEVVDGEIYAPGAPFTTGGKGFETFGSVVVNSFTVNGAPNLYFVYPQHPRQFLENWTVSSYRITP